MALFWLAGKNSGAAVQSVLMTTVAKVVLQIAESSMVKDMTESITV